MSNITLSQAVRSNLLSLQNTASLLDTTQTRLATGNKVNSALDNPTSYFTASGLNSRASDLGNLLDSVSNAVQTIQAANDGITSITKLVESAQATANQALQLQATIPSTGGAVTEVDATAATSNTTSLSIVADTAQSLAVNTTSNTTSLTIVADVSQSLAAPTTSNLTSVTIADPVVEVDATSTTGDLSSLNATGGTITVNGQNVVVAPNAGNAGVLSALQAAATAGGFSVVDNGTTNGISITSDNGTNLVIGGDSTTLTELGLTAGTINGTPPVAGTSGTITVNGQNVVLANGDNAAAILTKFQTAASASSGANAFTVSNASGVLTITGTAGNDVTFGGAGATLTALGLTAGTTNGTPAVDNNAGNVTINGQTIALAGGDNAAAILTKFQAAATASSGANAFTVSNASGVLTITGTAGNDLVVGGDASSVSALGLTAGTTNGTAAVDNNAGNVTVNGQTIALAGGDNAAAILTKFQAAATASTGTNAFTVSNASGVLTITGTGGNNIVIGGDASTVTALGLTSGTTTGTPPSAGTVTQIANPARAALVSQYNGLLDQIDQLTADAGYNGNNLLSGASSQLKVVFNETGTSSLTISGKDTSATGLGLSKLTVGTEFNTNASITTILGNLKTAQDTLRSDASSFGSNLSIVQTRQDFTKALINTLQTGASNLTLADSNEEAANLLALQTRQSLSTKALSLASQSDQNVLRLLQ